MTVFLITFVIFLGIIFIMSLGVIFRKKSIKGSCGGIASLGLEKICDCDNPCEKRQQLILNSKKVSSSSSCR